MKNTVEKAKAIILEGTKLVSANTLKSWWDNDCIEVVDKNGNEYRIKAKELLKLLKKAEFVQHKKVKHIHLEVIEK